MNVIVNHIVDLGNYVEGDVPWMIVVRSRVGSTADWPALPTVLGLPKQQPQEAVSAVKQPVYSGLFIHDMKVEDFTRTMQMAKAGGAAGVYLFSADGTDAAKWQALRRA